MISNYYYPKKLSVSIRSQSKILSQSPSLAETIKSPGWTSSAIPNASDGVVGDSIPS